jgi:hypothetical protein
VGTTAVLVGAAEGSMCWEVVGVEGQAAEVELAVGRPK